MNVLPRSLHLLLATACAMTLVGQDACAVEYRFTAEPIYAPDAAREIYKPLLDYLGRETGEKFVLVTPANYGSYWRNILKPASTDFSYDEAHFADYRIARSGFLPLVRTAEPTSYTLLANLDYEGRKPDSLQGKSIATMAAPSLGYALLAQFYPNPVEQPRFLSAARSWRDGVQMVFGGEADAAIVPTWLKDTYPNLAAIQTSRTFPGPAVLAAPEVPAEVRDKVRDALLKLGDAPELAGLLLELGISKFVAAQAGEYAGNRTILEGFYGYKPD
ncbi:MAG: PhnD/SsuA/transferrin family substrate-binding protein [Xanthomonadales bacterium]|nr:PhnD/SsuA/transferrin family substrate-binding protein [Xanthomonadales bacterium]